MMSKGFQIIREWVADFCASSGVDYRFVESLASLEVDRFVSPAARNSS
jgi:hypothetical protein